MCMNFWMLKRIVYYYFVKLEYLCIESSKITTVCEILLLISIRIGHMNFHYSLKVIKTKLLTLLYLYINFNRLCNRILKVKWRIDIRLMITKLRYMHILLNMAHVDQLPIVTTRILFHHTWTYMFILVDYNIRIINFIHITRDWPTGFPAIIHWI